MGIDLSRARPDRRLRLAGGVIKPFQTAQMQECKRDVMRNAIQREIDIHLAVQDLAEADQRWVIEGEIKPDTSGEEVWESGRWYGVRGFFDWMESRSYKMHVRVFLSRYRTYTLCRACGGTRFKPETLNFRGLAKSQQLTLPELQQLPLEELIDNLTTVAVAIGDSTTELLRTQIVARLRYLVDVGLGYLTLDRPTRSLSGGELQRVILPTFPAPSPLTPLFLP